MGKMIEIVNPAFADIDMQVFSKNWEDEAWSWLDAKPAK
jgi:hypothetical protein